MSICDIGIGAYTIMIIKYPISTQVLADAISTAKSMAASHGFKLATIIDVKQTAATEWLITLNVTH